MRVRRKFRLRMPHGLSGKVGLTAQCHVESLDANFVDEVIEYVPFLR